MTDLFRAHDCAPYPEFVAEGHRGYEVRDSRNARGLVSNGSVDKVERVLHVPFEPTGRGVARHELAHVLFSPDRWPRQRIHPGYLMAVEDGRINLALRRIGLPFELEPEDLERVLRLARRDFGHQWAGLWLWALRTVASFGTNATEPLLALAREADARAARAKPRDRERASARDVARAIAAARQRLETAAERSGEGRASFEQARSIARRLRRDLRALGLSEPYGESTTWCLCYGKGDGGDALRSGDGGVRPGTLSLARPPLEHPCALDGERRSRRKRAESEGAEIGDVSRIFDDQKIFRRVVPRRRRGASVLIDTSGSMRFEAADLDRLLSAAPRAMLVALYSGHDQSGELRIVAERGRRAAPEHLERFGMGNIVDLPALEWLARQPWPRLWISDGGVTGRGDRPCSELRARAKRLCRNAQIQRLPDLESAARELGVPPREGDT